MLYCRRRLLALIGAFLAPVAGSPFAQTRHRAYYRIGFLTGADIAGRDRLTKEFVDGMRELGYDEGRHYSLLILSYGNDRARIARAADELIGLQPDVIVANVSSTAAVLKKKTSAIPIVMATAIDPVGEGLAETLAYPGGNVTGLTSLSQSLHAKLIEFSHVLLPDAKRFALVVNPDHALAPAHQAVAGRAARQLGLETFSIPVRTSRETGDLAQRLVEMRADVLIVSADAVLYALREALVKAGLEAGVPTVSVLAEFAAAGALATYGHNLAANFRAAARYVDKILKGAKPGELPIEQPTQFELVLNVKTARALRITVPQAVLLRADRVVE